MEEHGAQKTSLHPELGNGFKLISNIHTESLELLHKVDMVVARVESMQRHSNLSTGDQHLEMRQILGEPTETIADTR